MNRGASPHTVTRILRALIAEYRANGLAVIDIDELERALPIVSVVTMDSPFWHRAGTLLADARTALEDATA